MEWKSLASFSLIFNIHFVLMFVRSIHNVTVLLSLLLHSFIPQSGLKITPKDGRVQCLLSELQCSAMHALPEVCQGHLPYEDGNRGG
jgi:hypothetical protein